MCAGAWYYSLYLSFHLYTFTIIKCPIIILIISLMQIVSHVKKKKSDHQMFRRRILLHEEMTEKLLSDTEREKGGKVKKMVEQVWGIPPFSGIG